MSFLNLSRFAPCRGPASGAGGMNGGPAAWPACARRDQRRAVTPIPLSPAVPPLGAPPPRRRRPAKLSQRGSAARHGTARQCLHVKYGAAVRGGGGPSGRGGPRRAAGSRYEVYGNISFAYGEVARRSRSKRPEAVRREPKGVAEGARKRRSKTAANSGCTRTHTLALGRCMGQVSVAARSHSDRTRIAP